MTRIMVVTDDEPLKLQQDPQLSADQLHEQAEALKSALIEVPADRPITCIDERTRAGLLCGEPTEPRFSVPGGSNIYGLYVAELTGRFGRKSELSAIDRLRSVTHALRASQIPSGGHEGCAANEKFGAILGLIASDQIKAYADYAAQRLDSQFNPQAAAEVQRNAAQAIASGVYAGWNGTELKTYLGPESMRAIEVLDPIPHNGLHWAENNLPGRTIDQNVFNQHSGQYTFVFDNPTAAEIESALTGQNSWNQSVAQHARLIVSAAIQDALPNRELYGHVVSA